MVLYWNRKNKTYFIKNLRKNDFGKIDFVFFIVIQRILKIIIIVTTSTVV